MRLLKLKPNMIKISPKERLHNLDIPIIGLTGGIATGKSSLSKLFIKDNICLIDADQLIKEIYTSSETIEFIRSICPQSVTNNSIDFKVLRETFFNSPNLKSQIENFLYQRLPKAFLNKIIEDTKFIVYDVPLLFENNLQNKFDQIILVYASKEQQIQRLMERDNISKDLSSKIINQQLDIESKKELSDFIIDNSSDLQNLDAQYQQLKKSLFQ